MGVIRKEAGDCPGIPMVQVKVRRQRQDDVVEGRFTGFNFLLHVGGMPHIGVNTVAQQRVDEYSLAAAIDHYSFIRQVRDLNRGRADRDCQQRKNKYEANYARRFA